MPTPRLLNLANRKTGSPESIQLTQKALDNGWADPKHRKLIIDAISASKHMPSAAKVLAALDDPDAEVKGAAERAAKAMRIQKIEDKTPKLMTLKPEEALAAVLKEKGDIGARRANLHQSHLRGLPHRQGDRSRKKARISATSRRPTSAPIWRRTSSIRTRPSPRASPARLITLKDGTQQMGFITLEGANEVKLRNIAAQEFTFEDEGHRKRDKLPSP